jgi:hypothetical protein
MTAEQRQELTNLLTNLKGFESNIEVQILSNEIREAINSDITLREYRKRKKQRKKNIDNGVENI